FNQLPLEVLYDLAVRLKVKEFKAGNEILTEGKDIGHEGAYIITQGSIEIVKNGHIIKTIEAGSFENILGEGAFLNLEGKRNATVVAKTDVKLLQITTEDFKGVLQRRPGLKYNLYALSATRTNENGMVKPGAASPVALSTGQLVNWFDKFLSFMMGKMSRLLLREPFANPGTNKGEITEAPMGRDLLKRFNLRSIKAQRDQSLFRLDKFYLNRLKSIKVGNAVGIPEFPFFLKRFKLWYARFHNLSPPVKFAFGLRHRPRSDYLGLILSEIFKYYRKMPSACRMSQG
ncbi:MAG: cyclic nucleotide-binding domain-containing protein, partial [Candidatus Omnitrophota bacterium]|nr:cyclic nucleotide-binding domain-containing protein [Candidatus Omnitrophota bacterium]